jgi:hypothetical protein
LGCEEYHILKYSQLSEYKSLIDLLPEQFDYRIILIESNKNSGHWVALIRQRNIIECFNSYGIMIDKEFRFIPDWIERWLGENTRYLSNLIKTAPDGITVISNRVRFQKDSPAIATCGRWVVFRIEMARMGYSLSQFIESTQRIQEKFDVPYDELIVGWVPFVQDRLGKAGR